MDALAAIGTRRSIGRLIAPAPTDAELRRMLEAGARAPDHGELRPWRFTVLRAEAIESFGKVLEDAYRARCRQAGTPVVEAKAAKERTKLGRAPLVVIVAAVCDPAAKIPWIEQFAAAAAASQNVLVAATALGYGSMWRTGDPCYDEAIKAALGLGPDDAIVGFLYLGTASAEARAAKPPRPPDLTGLVTEWPG
jgi:nitroreductase